MYTVVLGALKEECSYLMVDHRFVDQGYGQQLWVYLVHWLHQSPPAYL